MSSSPARGLLYIYHCKKSSMIETNDLLFHILLVSAVLHRSQSVHTNTPQTLL